MPASRLLAELSITIKSIKGQEGHHSTAETDVTLLKSTLNSLERLLARNFFQPALVRIIASDPQTSPVGLSWFPTTVEPSEVTSNVNTGNFNSALSLLFEAAKGDSREPALATTVRQAIPRLLDVAIRSSGTGRPTKQHTQWVETIFTSLASCLGITASRNAEANFQADSMSLLTSMLRILASRRVTVSTNILSALIERYSGLLQSSLVVARTKPDYNLVAAIVDLDADVFLPVEYLQRKRSEAQQMVPSTLLGHLSSCRSPRIENDAVGDLTDLNDSNTTCPTFAKYIVSPLINAYAQRHILDKFLRILYHHLQLQYRSEDFTREKGESDGPCSYLLWEDASVARALTPLVEKQFTPSQISTLIETFMAPIVSIFEENERTVASEADEDGHYRVGLVGIDHYMNSRASAGLLLVKLLVEGITSENYQDQLLDQLSLVQSTLVELLELPCAKKLKARWLVWRIVSFTQTFILHPKSLVSPRQLDFEENNDGTFSLAAYDCSNHKKLELGFCVAYEALSFIASLLKMDAMTDGVIGEAKEVFEMTAKFVVEQFSSITDETSIACFRWIGQSQTIQTPQGLAFAYMCVFSRFPVALE